jgi:hypothetical protein
MANTDAAIVAGALALVLAAGITVAVHGNPDTDATSGAPSPAPAAPATPAAPSSPAVLAPTTPVATSVVPTVAVTAPTPSVPLPTPSPQVTVAVTPAPATAAYSSTLTIVYTVKPGDNLSVIAGWFHAHGYGAIYAANRSVIGRDPALIHPGQRIKIVGGTPTTTP